MVGAFSACGGRVEAYTEFWWVPEGKRPFGRPRFR
jgi:hypothetical protein